ncbi:MAG: hypothetical protein ACFFD4_09000, partial [Candidatus Odinarchaeota archaeon]
MLKERSIITLLIIIALFNSTPASGAGVADRPAWLLSSDEVPAKWTYNKELEIDGRYYMKFEAPSGAFFSIETLEFSNASAAELYVSDEINGWKIVGQLERYYPNEKVNPTLTDYGVAWEVKSPCCLSRGVVYSVN